MWRFNSVCVYCGSSSNASDEYFKAAEDLARCLVGHGMTVVFGGSHVGLMGRLADTALSLGGRVVGVIPQSLVDREVAHTGLQELHVVESMHDRKALMSELAGAFIAMPGGFGTLDELFETLTWAQLRFHSKPVGLLNIKRFYDPLIEHCRNAAAEGFLHPEHHRSLLSAEDPEELLKLMNSFTYPEMGKWWIKK